MCAGLALCLAWLYMKIVVSRTLCNKKLWSENMVSFYILDEKDCSGAQQEESLMGKMVVVVEVCSLDEATSQDLDTSTACICLCYFIFCFHSRRYNW
jgi:hypothetical protein